MKSVGVLLSDIRGDDSPRKAATSSGLIPEPEKIYVQVANAIEQRRQHYIAKDNEAVIVEIMSFDKWFIFQDPKGCTDTLYGVNVRLTSGSTEMQPETRAFIKAGGYNVRYTTEYFKKLTPANPANTYTERRHVNESSQCPCYTIWMNPKLFKKKEEAPPKSAPKSNMGFKVWSLGGLFGPDSSPADDPAPAPADDPAPAPAVSVEPKPDLRSLDDDDKKYVQKLVQALGLPSSNCV